MECAVVSQAWLAGVDGGTECIGMKATAVQFHSEFPEHEV